MPNDIMPETPLPWTCAEFEPKIYGNAQEITTTMDNFKDALYIVHACNSFPALTERVRVLEEALKGLINAIDPKIPGRRKSKNEPVMESFYVAPLAAAREALKGVRK